MKGKRKNQMKVFKILIVFTLSFMFGNILVVNASGSDSKSAFSVVSLTHDDKVTYYDKFDTAVNEAKNGDTITLLKTISYVNMTNYKEDIEINKNIKFALGSKYIKQITFTINSGANVEFIATGTDSNQGGLNPVSNNKQAIVIKNGTVTLDNIRSIARNSNLIQVGEDNSNSEAKLILKGKSFLIASTVIQIKGLKSSVDINDAKKIEGDPNAITLSGVNNVVNINGGEYINALEAAIHSDKSSIGSEININGGTIASEVSVDGNSPKLNMTQGTIQSYYGISVGGTNATIDIKGGIVKGLYAGILGKQDAINPNITINGGTIQGYVDPSLTLQEGLGKPSGILFKSEGNLTINKGIVDGYFGIVAFQGNVTINGGEIGATGEGENKPIGGENSYQLGTAVVVDNTVGTLSKPSKVTITGGKFNATAEKALISQGNTPSDYVVSGGVYDKPFNEEFVVPNELELKINNEDTWYVGDDARKVLEDKKNDAGTEIEVLHGDVTIIDAATGLKVKNSGNGKVVVNEVTVEENQEIIAEPAPEKQAPTTPSNPDVNGDQDDVPNTGVENPQTGDGIITYIIMGTLSLLGLAGITTKRLILNKR